MSAESWAAITVLGLQVAWVLGVSTVEWWLTNRFGPWASLMFWRVVGYGTFWLGIAVWRGWLR